MNAAQGLHLDKKQKEHILNVKNRDLFLANRHFF